MIADAQKALDQVRDELTCPPAEWESVANRSPAGKEEENGTVSPATLDHLDLQPTGPVPERIQLRDLLRYYDRSFVDFAYQCILKRPADSGGDWHLDRLRRGKPAIETILHIRYGREGKSQNTPVHGLQIHRAIHRLARLPLLGHLVRSVSYTLRVLRSLATLPREQGAWKHHTMSLFAKVEDHVNRGFRRISAALSEKADARQLANLAENLQREVRASRAITEDQVRSIQTELRQLKTELTSTGREVRGLVQREHEIFRRLDDLESSRADADQLSQRLDRLESTRGAFVQVTRRVEQLERTTAAWEDVIRRVEEQDLPEADHDDFYAKFEDRFRGSRDVIRGRQEYYVPFVKAAGAGTTEAPVLDLGCGRGEWLNLLRDHGLVARGVEINDVFLRRCRQEQLDVAQAPALEYLQSATPGSLGAITGFHIIEHMPADAQLRLIRLAFQALRPGGVLILETPNPSHLGVAALQFYYDPTHIRQIPSVLIEFMANHVGFRDVRIELSAPSDDGEAAQGWSRFQDYALIAVRPADE